VLEAPPKAAWARLISVLSSSIHSL
jgi:hypothetical protein